MAKKEKVVKLDFIEGMVLSPISYNGNYYNVGDKIKIDKKDFVGSVVPVVKIIKTKE